MDPKALSPNVYEAILTCYKARCVFLRKKIDPDQLPYAESIKRIRDAVHEVTDRRFVERDIFAVLLHARKRGHLPKFEFTEDESK